MTDKLQDNNYIANINTILVRTKIECEIKEILNNFEKINLTYYLKKASMFTVILV